MKQIWADKFWRSALQGALGILVLALMTFGGVRLHASAVTVVLLYLLVIVVMSLRASFVPAAVVSAVAVLSLQYFFITPILSFALTDPLDVLALAAFLTIALVITRLVSRTRESSQQWKDVFENNPTMYFIVDAAGTTLSVNPFGAEQLGYTVDELVGQSVSRVFHEADREAAQRYLAACLELGGQTMNWEIRKVRKDGTMLWVRETAKAARRESHWIVLIACEDITESKHAAEALVRQANLLEQTHDAIFVWEFPRRIIFWNRGAERLYGFSREEAIGRASHELLQTEHPLPTSAFEAALERTGAWTGELTQTTRGGRRILVESRHLLMREADGRRLVLETNRDITEQRQAEEAMRKAQAELTHVARVTTLGEMAASIAHEVDQPLSGVVINANACLRFLTGPSPNLDEVRDGLQAIARDGRRASDVTARIRALARRTATEKELLDINEVIREVITLAGGEVRRARARVRSELAGDLPRVLGDAVQLQQVVLNLLLNALEAMNAVTDRQRELVFSTERDGTDHVRVAVQDSGTGIDAQVANRLFEAFYTTKRGGLGMGLSISRTIVEQHGGRLWAVPNDGPGTTFHFTV